VPVTRGYLDFHLKPHGVSVERIRRDRILHEALTGRPDPLHLSLMFGISERPPVSTRASPAISWPGRTARRQAPGTTI
jgi:hypothetical protein